MLLSADEFWGVEPGGVSDFERDPRGAVYKQGWLLWRSARTGWYTDGWGEWYTKDEAEALAEVDRMLGRAPAPAPAPPRPADPGAEAMAFFSARPPGECPCGRMRAGCPWHDEARP